MAADDARSIAEEIDANPDSVGVTPAEERESDVDAPQTETDARATWADVWEHCSLSGVVSKTVAATALEAHPDTGFHKHDPARQRVQAAIDDGVLVETGAHGTKVAVEEDCHEYV